MTRPSDEVSWPEVLFGVAILLAGIALLDCMGAVAKHLGTRYPAQQVSVARNLRHALGPGIQRLSSGVGL